MVFLHGHSHKNKLVVARGQRSGEERGRSHSNRELVFNGYRVRRGVKVMEMDGNDGCTTVQST